jgi:hypothetical protein
MAAFPHGIISAVARRITASLEFRCAGTCFIASIVAKSTDRSISVVRCAPSWWLLRTELVYWASWRPSRPDAKESQQEAEAWLAEFAELAGNVFLSLAATGWRQQPRKQRPYAPKNDGATTCRLWVQTRSFGDVGSMPGSPPQADLGTSSSLSSGDEVPHIFTRKSRLQSGEFLITSENRLLQQYLPGADLVHCNKAPPLLDR